MTDEYATPEGFILHRPLIFPAARTFDDVFEEVRSYRHGDLSGVGKRDDMAVTFDGNTLGSFCSSGNDRNLSSLRVKPRPEVLEALRASGGLVTNDDKLSWRVFVHKHNARMLVVLEHHVIIGSRYIAYIDPATYPTL